MSATIMQFGRPPVRALVVEQLNERQWHSFVEPFGSAAITGSGACSMAQAARDADEIARTAGLPVMIQWLRCPRITLNQARRKVPLSRGGAA